MFFLNRKEKAIAKHNKRVQEAQEAYNGNGKCYTCKYKKLEDCFYGYHYMCKLHYPKPLENEKCIHHIYDKKNQKNIDYVEKNVYKEFFKEEIK